MRLIFDQVSNIRLRPSPREDIGATTMPRVKISRWTGMCKLCLVMGLAGQALLPTSGFGQTAWSDSAKAKRSEQYQALDPQKIAQSVTVEDDELEPAATLSTVNAFKFRGGFTERVRADNFIRARIDKASGKTIFQVYEHIVYGGGWRRFSLVNYASDSGLQSEPLTIIAREPSCQYGTCVFTEDVGFNLPENLLRGMSATAASQQGAAWRFRFKAQDGDDWTDDLPYAEAAGLLIAVDKYRASHNLK